MHTIQVRNVHDALFEGLNLLEIHGSLKTSRAGEVLVAVSPVMTVYERPQERVLFWPERDANPFFHLMEALWMLAGRNDVEWIARFNSRMREYSDDGKYFHGAYGYRWRNHFYNYGDTGPIDQLELAAELLRRSPNSRRAVIQMWDCTEDLLVDEEKCKDIPCNDLIFLWNNFGALDMTVVCRSNDIIWGAYGANSVHFSILQEYLASKLGWRVGMLYQLSNNFHAYIDIFKKHESILSTAEVINPYRKGTAIPYPLVDNPEMFDEELSIFMDDNEFPDFYLHEYPKNKFLTYSTAMRRAYFLWRERKIDDAISTLVEYCPPLWDFRKAGVEWLSRR